MLDVARCAAAGGLIYNCTSKHSDASRAMRLDARSVPQRPPNDVKHLRVANRPDKTLLAASHGPTGEQSMPKVSSQVDPYRVAVNLNTLKGSFQHQHQLVF